MPGQAALAFDRLDHGALFAADVGAGAAANVQLGVLGEAGRLELGDLLLQDLDNGGVFVADVDEDLLGLDGPRGNQRAFQELVRLALEIVAILEGAGLALVAVDGHQPRALFAAHEAPFASRREACAAETAQAAIGKSCDHIVGCARAREARPQYRVTACLRIGVEILECGDCGMHLAARGDCEQLAGRCVIDVVMADLGGRRRIARADAGSTQHAYLRHSFVLKLAEQFFCAGQHAAQAVAHPDGNFRGTVLILTHDVEMRIEGRDLVDLRHGDPEFFGQSMQMTLGQAPFLVLDEVQIFDQQGALARSVTRARL